VTTPPLSYERIARIGFVTRMAQIGADGLGLNPFNPFNLMATENLR